MKSILEKNCEPKNAILEAINFLKLGIYLDQNISGKNHQDLFPHTWPSSQSSPEDQSVPFGYQLGLCQCLCEMVKKIFQINIHGI